MKLVNILFSFEGRINRRPLWGFWLFVNAFNLLAFGLAYSRLAQTPLPAELTPEFIRHHFGGFDFLDLISLTLLWPTFALAIKRAHDRDHSGWFLLLGLIPLLNIWVFVEIALLAGTPGANRFGPDPLPSAKPGLGWLILLGHLILAAIQAYLASVFFTFAFAHLPRDNGPATPDSTIQPAPDTHGLRRSNI